MSHADPNLPPPAPEHRAVDFVERPRLWDSRRNVLLAFALFAVLCGLALAADLVVHRHLTFAHDTATTGAEHVAPTSPGPAAENPLPEEAWLGFYGIYGFVGIVLLVIVSVLLRLVVMRGENYYGEGPTMDGSAS